MQVIRQIILRPFLHFNVNKNKTKRQEIASLTVDMLLIQTIYADETGIFELT